MHKRILVTGGSGFIGGQIVKQLDERGDHALILDVQAPYLYQVPESAKFVRCDVRDGYQVAKAVNEFGGVDAIIHLAGVLGTSWLLDQEELGVENNIKGTLPVLRLARDLNVKIVAPTVANSWLNPYTITKMAAGNFMRMFAQEYGVKISLVRETHVYGPRQAIDERQKLIPTLIGSALLGKPLPLFMQGEQHVDLVYVRDAAESLIRLALTPDAMVGETAEFATGRLIKVKDVAEMVLDVTESKSELQFLGRRPGQTGEDDEPNDLARLFGEVGEWSLTRVEDGLAETAKWYRDNLWAVGGDHLAGVEGMVAAI